MYTIVTRSVALVPEGSQDLPRIRPENQRGLRATLLMDLRESYAVVQSYYFWPICGFMLPGPPHSGV
jgi:hypothetical protein